MLAKFAELSTRGSTVLLSPMHPLSKDTAASESVTRLDSWPRRWSKSFGLLRSRLPVAIPGRDGRGFNEDTEQEEEDEDEDEEEDGDEDEDEDEGDEDDNEEKLPADKLADKSRTL